MGAAGNDDEEHFCPDYAEARTRARKWLRTQPDAHLIDWDLTDEIHKSISARTDYRGCVREETNEEIDTLNDLTHRSTAMRDAFLERVDLELNRIYKEVEVEMTSSIKSQALMALSMDSSTTTHEREAAKRAFVRSSDGGLVGVTREMPAWVKNIWKNPCPHQSTVNRLRTIYPYGRGNEYEDFDRETREDEFVLRSYASLGLVGIHVVVGDKKIEIYSTKYEGGWRDGPWWQRLETSITKILRRHEEEQVRQQQQKTEKHALEKHAEDNLFSQYVNSQKMREG